MYPVVVPNLITHVNIYHSIIVFVDSVHAFLSKLFNLTRINIKSTLLLHSSLQIFWNHTEVVESLGFIHTICNKVGTFCIPFQDLCLCNYFILNLYIIWPQLILCHPRMDASYSFFHNTTGKYFFIIILLCLLKIGWFVEIIHYRLIALVSRSIKTSHHFTTRWINTFS